ISVRQAYEREKLREALGDAAPAKEVPKTIESTREYDETMVQENDDDEHDEAHDEFAQYFNRETTPKVLITMSPFARKTTWKFCFELHKCIPNSEIFSRKGVPLKKVVKQAISKSYTDLLVVHEDQKRNQRCGESTDHNPEIVLNNFNTRLGHSIARMFACLFPHDPKFTGRRVVTFHNQRDYIFFRHHR
ncbi:brix domain protein, partial [Ostertagia ostertagi]